MISDYLNRGQGSAVTTRKLCEWTGLDTRTLRQVVETERRGGAPICSSTVYGYYLADNEAEKTACVRSMRHRAAEILRTADALEAAEVDNNA